MSVLVVALLFQFISTVIFVWDAKGIKVLEVQFKAKCFGIMEICFGAGIIIDVMPFIPIEITFLAKILVCMASIFLYVAIKMPEWATKRFIKN